MKNRKIMIIGTGGIGSYLVDFLSRLGIYDITVFDFDKLEEKNLTYQNFMSDMVGENKVDALVNRLKINRLRPVKIEPYEVLVAKQLRGYDLVICCADNLTVRRLMYREGHGEDCPVKWLDLRAQGRNGILISYKVDPSLIPDLLAGADGSFSCQGGDWDGSAKDIDCTHIAIAGIAAQWIQRWWQDNNNVFDKMVLNI